MYLCICNALRSTDVAEAADHGAQEVEAVHAFHGTRTQCGKCRDGIEEYLCDRAWGGGGCGDQREDADIAAGE